MRNFLILLCMCFLVFMGGYMASADSQNAAEEYDEEEYGPLEPMVWNKPVKTVVFFHKSHTMVAELDCDSCHDELFEMEEGAAEEEENFTMQAMYDGESCGSCHDGDTAFAANTRCTTCHIGVRGHARMTGKKTEGEEKTDH